MTAAGLLRLDYQAPHDVDRLAWIGRDSRLAKLGREPHLKAIDGCGHVERDMLVLGDAVGCRQAARFEITPQVLGQDAMYEAAQPASDGGVLLYTSYYGATASGKSLRWRFVPPTGGYVLDAAREWTAVREVVADASAVDAFLATPDSEEAMRALHASHTVFLGRLPLQRDGELLWARDPALPANLSEPVAMAARAAMLGFAKASGRPSGGAAIIMLASDKDGWSFHGDRADERMIRLSFARTAGSAERRDIDSARHFVAHEIAHLWNHGVYTSDMGAAWLHEGDAEWASGVLMLQTSLLAEAALRDQLEAAVNACLLRRGERPAASLNLKRVGGDDDPYACGTALQLLSWARQYARDTSLDPLDAWGAMHRAVPHLDAAGFARYGDGPGDRGLQHLLLDDSVPFGSTYVRLLAAVMPLQMADGEPVADSTRRRVAATLMQHMQTADCGGYSFYTQQDGIAFDGSLACSTLPRRALWVAIAGEPLLQRPVAAWRAARAACTAGQPIELAQRNGPPAYLPCPARLPTPPTFVTFASDALQRIGLASPMPTHGRGTVPAFAAKTERNSEQPTDSERRTGRQHLVTR